MFSLVSFFGQDDSDILPFFLKHYRSLGVEQFHIYIHGEWTQAELMPLRAGDVTIAGIVQSPFDVFMKSAAVEVHAKAVETGWLMLVDADEFLEVPYGSLTETTHALDRLGLDELPCLLLQRAADDGSLPVLSEDASPDGLFPCYDFRLAERMTAPYPIWKNKYPLVRAGSHLLVSRGYHLPLTGRPSAHVPIRGVLHHFKWRDRLLRSIARIRGDGSNQREQDGYRRWLQDHDGHLPTEGLRRLSREALFADGHLMRPTRSELARLSALRREAGSGAEPAGERAKKLRVLNSVPPAAEQLDERALAYLDRSGALVRPGRIALVTSDILGLRRSGGIGTAIAGLAERSSAAGHEVHVFLSPYADFPKPYPTMSEYWEARGVRIHYIPRDGENGRILGSEEMSLVLCEALASSEWDAIHLPEAGGLGTAILQHRAAGLAFQNTQIAITVHGPTRWHRSGNFLPWTRSEAEITEMEAISIELADVLIFPSAHMLDWSRRHFSIWAPCVVIPNALTGDSRTFGRLAGKRKRVRKIVFFGRIELRKGIDRFIAAIETVLASGPTDFEVIFLGSFGQKFSEADLARRTEHWPCKRRFLVNYTTHDAMELLRTEDCIAVIPSRLDNSPYTVYECVENGIPFIASDVGGVPELVSEADRDRVLVRGEADEYAAKLIEALRHGVKPASPRFDPFQADLDLLSLHGHLVEAARSSRGTVRVAAPPNASIILYGAGAIDPDFVQGLRRWEEDGARIVIATRDGPPEPVGSSASDRDAAMLNRLAWAASEENLLFCHVGVVPRLETLAAMLHALASTKADAVVCGYETVGVGGEPEIVPVFAGPPELAVSRNVYGARLFLVRRESFERAGGFGIEREIADLFEWEFLNRLKGSGLRVVAIPAAMAFVRHPEPRLTPNEYQVGRLAAPWTALATGPLQGLIRMALHPERKAAHPATNPQATHANGAGANSTKRTEERVPPDLRGLELASLLARRLEPNGAAILRPGSEPANGHAGGRSAANGAPSFAASRSAETEPDMTAAIEIGRRRIGPDGMLLDPAETYFIRSPEDAESCDFYVADGIVEADVSEAAAAAFRDITRSMMNGGKKAPLESTFLHFEELFAASRHDAELIVEAVRRASQQTAHFYGLDVPLYPASLAIMQAGRGSFAVPRRAITLPKRVMNGTRPGYCGLIHLNDELDGGASYFTALDIAVEPRRGRFVGSTSSAYHERAMLRVNGGAATTISFVMGLSPDAMSRSLRRLY